MSSMRHATAGGMILAIKSRALYTDFIQPLFDLHEGLLALRVIRLKDAHFPSPAPTATKHAKQSTAARSRCRCRRVWLWRE
jgi:hypothetical protein